MSRRNLSIGFVAGLLAGVLGTIALTGGPAVPRAMAQNQATQPGLTQRYELSSWAHPASYSGTGNFSGASHGAYILDTQTGKVWQVSEGGQPKALGLVQ